MDQKFLTIYRSSAGSGKTYTLTREYLRLALRGISDHKYQKILAVTFTNKAMQEMKNRIVSQLNKFREGDFGSMGEELMADLGYDHEEFVKKANDLLSEILHDYSHFSITTIDAFFQRVIRSFARELGLAGSYKLELDPELTIHEIIQDLFAQVEDDKALRGWLIDYSMDKLEQGSSWEVEKDLEEYTKRKILSEDFQVYEEQIRNFPRMEIMELAKDLKEKVGIFRNKMKSMAQEGIRLMDKHALIAGDFTQSGRGPGVYFSNVLNDNFEPNFYVTRAVLDDKYTSGKKPVPKVEMALDDGLRDIFQELIRYRAENEIPYNTALAMLKNIYLLGLTQDILIRMKSYKREHDIMFISDATRMLTELVSQTDAPFIYERVGSFYDHFLIDEFQDTSLFQWKSFSPLITNSMSQGNANLIVGDVKQSIYRWRGGELELLQEKVEQQFGSAAIQQEQLRKNFRSYPSVINFNNSLFNTLPSVLGNTFHDDGDIAEQAVQYIESVYFDVKQQFPGENNERERDSGYVNIELLKGDKEKNWQEIAMERLPEIIKELQDKGVPLREVAILVRRNNEGQLAADTLAKYTRENPDSNYRFDFISNDSLHLSGSPACRLLMAALRYMNDPSNSVNRADLAYHFHKVHHESSDLGELFPGCDAKHSPEPTEPEKRIKEITSWEKRPFIELVEKLIHVLGLNRLKGEFSYIQTFQDLVLQFVSKERGDVASFILWWEQYAGRQSIKIPDDLDAIRIMTIHKSKGLEFHSVIMPFISWKVDHERSPDIWFQATHLEEVQAVPLKYNKILDRSEFATQYREERLKAYVDNLNMLYVGLTRASHDLWLTGPVGSKSSNASINTILQKSLEAGQFPLGEHWDKGALTLSYGNREFSYVRREDTQEVRPVELEKYEESHWEEELVLKPVTSSLIPSEREIKINTGIIIHQLLSKVRYTADFEKVLTEITWEEALSEEDVKRIKERISKSFENPHIKQWFSRKWDVINESAILTSNNEYRPDRVMMDNQEVVVIDYKTGIRNDKDIRQVKNYMMLLEELENKPVRGYLWYIDLEEIVTV